MASWPRQPPRQPRSSLLVLAALLPLAWSCGQGGEQQGSAQEAAGSAGTQARTATFTEPADDAEPIDVDLAFFRVRKLYQTFFSDQDATYQLGQDLAGKVRAPAQVRIAYDSETSHGKIMLVIPPDSLLLPVASGGDSLDLQALAPLTWALARYRDAISSRYDVRVSNFEIGIYSLRGPTSCTFHVTGGHPPDGTTISDCVELDGEEHCGKRGESGTRFSSRELSTIRTCLDL